MSDIVTAYGPCTPWVDLDEARSCGNCPTSDITDTVLSANLQSAQEVLFILSGRQFTGICDDVIRPNCGCRSTCVCDSWQVDLGSDPVHEVTEVLLNGEILDPSQYLIADARYLIRLADENGVLRGWPVRQDIRRPTTELRTFQVSFTHGRTPPAIGVTAVIDLACELARSCTPGMECALDRRVTQVTRQGVTMALPGLIDAMRDGKTGLPSVDLFLHTFNPAGLRRRASVHIPENHHRTRRVG